MENVPVERNDSLPFVIMDKLDDELIIQELEGRLPEILTYHFDDGKQEVWGLSKAGVDEATGELAKKGEVIRELEMTFVDNDDEAYFQVKSGRYVISKDGKELLLDTKFGAKRQPKKYKNGSENGFWYEQGAMKAARNASMRLIPKPIQQAVIEYAKQKGKVKDVVVDMEEFKKTSEKLFSAAHDGLVACKNLKELKTAWNIAYKNKPEFLPEHFQLLETLKNELKGKLNG